MVIPRPKLRRLTPAVVRWVEQLQFRPAGLRGALLPDDAVPETLKPVLGRMARKQLPVLVDSAHRVRQWLTEHPDEPLPRTLGRHGFALEGCTSERIVRPYSLWMLQRVRDHFKRLGEGERLRAEALLREVGAGSLIDFPDPPRLVRERLSVKPG